MLINLGPQHPSTHGVLRVVLKIDGEQVVDLDPVLGYLHRGVEKICENGDWHHAISNCDPLEYVASMFSEAMPVLAAEKLLERHRIAVSKETLRQWMMEAGIWVSRRERKKRVFQPRGRRDCFGELVQIDGSLHWWFENRGPKCALLVFIDDATGQLLHLRFATSENTFDYFHAAKAYLSEWGKPLAFYSDKHGIFRVNRPAASTRGDGMTQFGRALAELVRLVAGAIDVLAQHVMGSACGAPQNSATVGPCFSLPSNRKLRISHGQTRRPICGYHRIAWRTQGSEFLELGPGGDDALLEFRVGCIQYHAEIIE
jgi:hypothetical protein